MVFIVHVNFFSLLHACHSANQKNLESSFKKEYIFTKKLTVVAVIYGMLMEEILMVVPLPLLGIQIYHIKNCLQL